MKTEEIKAVLESQEKIVWQDVISRKVMIFQLAVSLLIVVGLSFFAFAQEIISYNLNNTPRSIAGATVGLIILVVGLLLSLVGFFSNYVKVYTITNKRVLIKSGLIGTDFNSIYFTEVKTANVNVGLIDKIFSIGTINIDTGKIETSNSGNHQSRTRTAYDKLLHISEPYKVYKYFQTTLTGRQESLYSGRADKEESGQ
ncbi:MAG: PH domain-containing protein [Patescibacteria group bacterium]|jgi:uncharacterized membrane protein YdbT with pleckstrin-like domain